MIMAFKMFQQFLTVSVKLELDILPSMDHGNTKLIQHALKVSVFIMLDTIPNLAGVPKKKKKAEE